MSLRSFIFVATFLLVSTVLPGRGLTECAHPPFSGSFSDIGWGDIIFVGTLDRSEVVRSPGAIVTRFHFSQVRYIKGKGPKDEFVLAEVGGRIGNEEVITEYPLDFRVGRRYVANARKGGGPDSSRYYTLYAGGTHLFGIWAETPSGPQVVHIGNGGPLLAVRDRCLLVLRPQSWESAHPPSAYEVFERPPKRPINDELRLADSTYAADRTRQDPPSGVRLFGLWPHQDPGTRVTEGEFVDWLARVMAGDTGTPKDAPPGR